MHKPAYVSWRKKGGAKSQQKGWVLEYFLFMSVPIRGQLPQGAPPPFMGIFGADL